MGLFKRKTDYSYYSSYNSRRKLKIGRAVIAGIAGVVLVAAVIVYLNFNRIQFLWKGYSWSTTSEILSMFDSGEEAEILEHDKMDHILKWIDCSNKVELYDDYERYYAIAKKAIIDHGGVYFGAIGGAGAMMSACIEQCDIIAFDDLGPEAIRKLKVKDMPLVVVIDSQGQDLYEIGRQNYLSSHQIKD